MRRLLKIALIIVVVFLIYWPLNYMRLGVSFPKDKNLNEKGLWHNDDIYKSLYPPPLEEVDLPTAFTARGSDVYPYMGEHYYSFYRWFFKKFDPHKPTGFSYSEGRITSLIYTSFEFVPGYHWHKHNNLCFKQGLVVTDEFGFWECLFKGYAPFPNWGQPYMMHAWYDVEDPALVNDMWNSKVAIPNDPSKSFGHYETHH